MELDSVPRPVFSDGAVEHDTCAVTREVSEGLSVCDPFGRRCSGDDTRLCL